MKNSKLLVPLFSTILFAFGTISEATIIPTNILTPNGNNKIAGFGEAKDATDLLGQPIREMVDPYFNNIWYASLYQNVKQDIDNSYSGGNRINQYLRICKAIAVNKGLAFNYVSFNITRIPGEYISNHIGIVVKEENGIINCYQRVPQFPN